MGSETDEIVRAVEKVHCSAVTHKSKCRVRFLTLTLRGFSTAHYLVWLVRVRLWLVRCYGPCKLGLGL